MEIIREVSIVEAISSLIRGSATTQHGDGGDQDEYVCAACGTVFYSKSYCRYSLCEDCFPEFNLWLFVERDKLLKSGRPPFAGVEDWLANRQNYADSI
jgi:hypothetical protein